MKIKYSILFILALFITSCYPTDTQMQWVYVEHLVWKYYNIVDIEAVVSGREGGTNKLITLTYLNDGSVKKSEYRALCIKHGDIGYNRYIRQYQKKLLSYSNADFTKVSIISDADFDESHLADSELGDLVLFEALSPYAYIKSGYKIGSPMQGISKLVSELEYEDLILLGHKNSLAELKFLSEPTLSKTHNITITMTSDDGRVFQDTIRVRWE